MLRAVDLFAGAGGFTAGAEMAGVKVVWAANHWKEAVEVHASNHPVTRHVCQDLHQADWTKVPEMDIILASPACQGHSTASQPKRRPYHDGSRATAWAVVSCAEVHRPVAIIVENVIGFERWILFENWMGSLEKLGYSLTISKIDSADLGVPQNRKRLFIVGHLEDEIDIPAPSAPIQGIRSFLDMEDGKWVSVSDRVEKTQRRIARGRRKHGDVFLTHYVTNHPGRSLERPIGTITTKDHWAIVRGDETRMLTIDEYRRAMGFPEEYILPSSKNTAIKMLGNAIVPAVASYVIERVSERIAA